MPRPEGTGHVSGVVGAEAVVVREAATVVARRLARRRGLWMLLFGVVHGMAFAGDAIGTHALIATAFAGPSCSASVCGRWWSADRSSS